ncbi:MAG TPA: hypothetical protein VF043_07735 [Ktedonobacteraceae bacterium]
MILSRDDKLSRLIAKLESDPTKDVTSLLEEYRTELEQVAEDHERAARERALDSHWNLARMGKNGHVEEIIVVRVRELEAFARDRGLKYDEIKDVAEGRRRAAVGKGIEYRIYPLTLYVDHSVSQEDINDRLDDLREDERHRLYMLREQARKQAEKQPEPVVSTYSRKTID